MRNNCIGLILAAVVFLDALSARGTSGVTVKDATDRVITIPDSSRIVSVGGAVTEILYALGLEDRVVAVDTTSIHPPRALAEKRSVGYMRQLSPEGVLGLGPSLVLATEGSGPEETLAVLESAQVPFARVPDRFTGEGVIEKIRLIAKATGVQARGECLVRMVEADLATLATLRKRIEHPIKVLFVLSFMNGRPMAAGRATAAEGIIRLAGAENAVTGYEGYKLINDESVIAARPDAVLAMERKSFRTRCENCVRTSGVRHDAGGDPEGLCFHGRALSAGFWPPHGARCA